MFNRQVPIIVISLTLGLALGIGLTKIFSSSLQSSFSETRNPQKYQFINPLIECDPALSSSKGVLHSLEDAISQKIDSLKSSGLVDFVAVYFRDLNNGPWFGINQDEFFSPASLVKVPTAITYLKHSESDPQILTKELSVTSLSEYQNQNFQPETKLELNQTYSVEELLKRMIIYSDNVAYELLEKSIDNQEIVKTYSDLGIDISKGFSDPGGNIISVKDYASFFRILYNASYLNQTNSEKLLSLLSQSTFNQGLTAVTPKNIKSSHKYGERKFDTSLKQLHDCGIVYHPQKPYLICIMTRGQDFNKLSATIRGIADLVYKQVSLNQ
ncbi:MAG: serine hydrolase [Candidatus Shapirobacteria bacterium]|jgi:beta-lactamase class A